ncbi:MAG: hypothetical protein ABI123_05365, partial [Ginsengibacter sp.]
MAEICFTNNESAFYSNVKKLINDKPLNTQFPKNIPMFTCMKSHSFAIVGCGKLANIIVKALIKNLLPTYKLIGSYSGTFEKAQAIADKVNNSEKDYACKPCHSFEELLELKPDYLVETASPSAFREFALPALKNGSTIVTLSIGALADAEFYEKVQQTALENNTRVYLASGA